MKHQTTQKNRGVTLIELILYIGVLSVVLSGVIFFARTLLEAQARNSVITTVNEEGTLAISRMLDDIRNAEAITQPTEGASDNVLMLSTSSGQIIYDIDNGVLMKESGGISNALTSGALVVESVTFQHLVPHSIKIELLLSYGSEAESITYAYERIFHATATLRSF